MIYLVCGGTGAGKTTVARRRAQEQKGLVLSIDNWMKALYWQDMPEKPNMDWFKNNQKWYTDRIARCEALIWKQAAELGAAEVNVFLDLGFTTRTHRMAFIDRCKRVQLPVSIFYVKADSALRWERTQARQNSQSETYVMDVSKEMFDYMEDLFEEPDESLECGVEIVPNNA